MQIPSHTLFHLLLLLNRLALGFYFAFLGFGKVKGEFNNGFGNFYRSDTFQNRQPAWLPDAAATPFAYALPWAELIFGSLLILGLFGMIVAGVISLILLSIMVAQASTGGLFWLQDGFSRSGPYHTNVILFCLALLLTLTGPGRFSLDALWRRRKKKEE